MATGYAEKVILTPSGKDISITLIPKLQRFFPGDVSASKSDKSSYTPYSDRRASVVTDKTLESVDEVDVFEDESTSIWSRLCMAIDGEVQLTAYDAQVILTAFEKTLESEELMKAGRSTEAGDYHLLLRREEIVKSMKMQLMTPIGEEEVDEENDDVQGVLNYLTSNFLPLDTAQLPPQEDTNSRASSFNSMTPRRGSITLGANAINHNWREISNVFAKLVGGDGDKLLAALEEKVDGSSTLDYDDVVTMLHAATEESSLNRTVAVRNQHVETMVSSLFEWQTTFTFDEFRLKLKETQQLVEILENVCDWDFDLFAMNELTKTPLRVIGVHAARKCRMLEQNDFNSGKYENFLCDVEASYCKKNPYHNNLHAADVVQTCLHFLSQCHLIEASGFSPLATAGLLIAAAVHDVGHPGSNNHYLVATGAPLAIQYNDHSPLENMHLATAFTLMQKPGNNFLESLSPFVRKELRRIIIAMVLATDNDRHFASLEKLEALVTAQRAALESEEMDAARDITRDRNYSTISYVSFQDKAEEEDINRTNKGLTRCVSSPTNIVPTTSPNIPQSSVPFGMGQKNTVHHSNPESELSEHSLVRRATNVSSNLEQAFSLLTSQKVVSQGAFLRTPSVPITPPMTREASTGSGISDLQHKSTSSSGSITSPQSATLPPASLSGTNAGLLSQKSPQSDNAALPPRAPTPLTRMESSVRGNLGTGRRASPAVRASSANISNLLSRKSPQPNNGTTDPQQLLLLESTLHMADISNPAKPWEIYQRWLNRVMEEFYHQGDLERQQDMPITFGFDRNNPIPQTKFQMGFIKVIVSPLYSTFSRLPGISLDHCVDSLLRNNEKWNSLSEQSAFDASGSENQPK